MKTFTATPEEFASGQAAVKAHDLFKNRKPRGPRLPRKPVPRGAQQDRQIGTITPEDFGAGRPFWGHRAYKHRTGPVPTLKPLPEAIVDKLLESDVDDPAAFVQHFEPAALEIVWMAVKQILALPYDDMTAFYTSQRQIISGMVVALEKTLGRRALDGLKEMLSAGTPKPWNGEKFSRSYAREILASFKNCSKRVK